MRRLSPSESRSMIISRSCARHGDVRPERIKEANQYSSDDKLWDREGSSVPWPSIEGRRVFMKQPRRIGEVPADSEAESGHYSVRALLPSRGKGARRTACGRIAFWHASATVLRTMLSPELAACMRIVRSSADLRNRWRPNTWGLGGSRRKAGGQRERPRPSSAPRQGETLAFPAGSTQRLVPCLRLCLTKSGVEDFKQAHQCTPNPKTAHPPRNGPS